MPADGAAAHRADALPGRRDGCARARPHHVPGVDGAPADRGGAQCRRRACRRVRQPGGHRAGEGRAGRGAGGRRARRAERRRPAGDGDGGSGPALGCSPSARTRAPTCGSATSSSTTTGGPASPDAPRASRARSCCRSSGRTRRTTRPRQPPSPSVPGCPSTRSATASATVGPGRAGGWRCTTTPDGVTVINDAYNANPDSMRAALKSLADIGHRRDGARTIAVLGEMRELGDTAATSTTRIGRLAVRLDIYAAGRRRRGGSRDPSRRVAGGVVERRVRAGPGRRRGDRRWSRVWCDRVTSYL